MGGIMPGALALAPAERYLGDGSKTSEQGGSMARKLGLRTFALAALLGSAGVVVEMIHRTLNLSW
jgi:hypothetical protein